ncbi:integrase, catalytic region, zinc finger, CCHC-type containing protein [Tanacetum coccineum]
MLYDGSVIAKETNVISIDDSEETLMLEEESRSKMLLKQSDPMVLEKKVNTKPINYAELNRLSEDFAAILREIVEQAKSLNPLDSASYSACKYVKLIQELLGYVRDTCPDIHKPSKKLVTVTPINKKKKVRFAEPVISSSTSQKQLGSSQTKTKQTTNNFVSTSTGVSRSTKSSRSKSIDNTKNDRIQQISSSTQKKNKVENHSRIVKSCLNKLNCVVEPSGNANVQHFKLNTNSKLMCVKCNSSMFDARHELCFLEFVSDMNGSSKSKSVKKAKKKEEWKPTGKVFTKIRYNWRPTGRTFNVVVFQIVLWYLDSGCSKHMTRDRSQLTNFVHKFLGTVKFGNDQIIKITGSWNIRTDNGTEFVNQTLRSYYESVGISHETSVARSPQQKGVIERRNHTLIEVARTMLIYAKAPLFLWAEAVATASLCYTNNDSEDLGKLQAKADIGIFIGYAPKKKDYRPGLQFMTPTTSSSRLVANPIPQQPCNPPPRDDWDCLFQHMFDEYFNPSTIVVSPVLVTAAPRVVDLVDSPMSTSIDQDAPSTSIPLMTSNNVKMDDPNVTMEEYIRLEEEKAQRHGQTFNWQTATFGKVENYEDEDDCFIDFETEFPAIVFDNTLTSDTALPSEPTVDKFTFLGDFVVVDYDVNPRVPLILRRPFLRTAHALVDVHEEELTLRVGDEKITFNVESTSKYPHKHGDESINQIDIIDTTCEDHFHEVNPHQPPIPYPLRLNKDKLQDISDIQIHKFLQMFKKLHFNISFAEALSQMLKYAKMSSELLLNKIPEKLGDPGKFLIPCDFSELEECLALADLGKFSFTFPADFVVVDYDVDPRVPFILGRPFLRMARAGLIYPILGSPWVSLVHVVPKKGGMTVVTNDNNEFILTRLVMGWRVCIDYRKLNDTTRKDHFPLPFMDQMLERLARNEFYCFLDGFSGYFQIPIDLQDQKKTTFTCPYRTFAYRRMPFGLFQCP